MAVIETDGVTKRFDNVVAVDNIDITVREREIYCLIGPNGSGKTTLINLLLNFVQPTSGSVTVCGYDVTTESLAVREHIGIVPEGYGVYDRLTGRQHVKFAIEAKRADDDPIDVLKRVDLADVADQWAGEYSKGMAKRLILGTALVGDPDLLVFDEPFSGLDPTAFAQLRDIIHTEREQGTTVLLSTHLFGPVERLGDRMGILLNGELVAERDLDEVRVEDKSVESLFLTFAEDAPDPDKTATPTEGSI